MFGIKAMVHGPDLVHFLSRESKVYEYQLFVLYDRLFGRVTFTRRPRKHGRALVFLALFM